MIQKSSLVVNDENEGEIENKYKSWLFYFRLSNQHIDNMNHENKIWIHLYNL